MTKHRFARLEFRPIGLTRWRCYNCGMKVGNTKAAHQLEGQPCR